MQLIRDISGVQHLKAGCVATIGNYDGLHLGHQVILRQLESEAVKYNLPKVVISFEPLPSEFFTGDKAQRVYPFRDKARLLEAMGIDYFLCLRFDQAMATMPPADFVERILFQAMNVKSLMVGDDFCFGKDRKGDFNLLQSMGNAQGMQVHKTDTYIDDSGRISSTRIRQHLAKGDLDGAIEVNIFDFDETVYGKHIIVELCEFIRPEKKFEDFAALTAQIHKDAIRAAELLQSAQRS